MFLIVATDFYGHSKHYKEAEKLPPTSLAYKINERWMNNCAFHYGLFIVWLVCLLLFLFIA
jgi:hypothetical protein